MYGLTFEALRRSWRMMLPMVVVLAVAMHLFEGKASQVALGIVYGVIAFVTHRGVLLREDLGWSGRPVTGQTEAQTLPWWPFLWRFAVLALLATVLGTLIMAGILSLVDTRVAATHGVALLIGGLATACLTMGLLSLCGTVLAAAATGGDARLSVAIRRGRARFWRTFTRFIAGPLVVTVLGRLLLTEANHAGGPVFAPVLSLAEAALGSFVTMMSATILSMAYREAEALTGPA